MVALIIVVVCVLGIALSLRSLAVLRTAAPWTSAGWWLTVVYFVAEIAKVVRGSDYPLHAEYVVLVALTAAFVVAGVRDERQAEPWWWPSRTGRTRAEQRATRGA